MPGIALLTFVQIFNANGSWTAPSNLVGLPAVYAWGPGGAAANGTAGSNGGGGGGGGAFGGESALGGVGPGTVLTITVGTAGSGTATTVTGGSVTVQGNAGGNASGSTHGAGGTVGTNTLAKAGGAGGDGFTGSPGGGGGGGGSGGSTGAGGAGGAGTGTTAGSAGVQGTGPNPPPVALHGASGGTGGSTAGGNGTGGVTPGGGGGGGGNTGGVGGTGGTGHVGQVSIVWNVYAPVVLPLPRRVAARTFVQFTPVATTNATGVTPPAGTVQPWATVPVPRRVQAVRAYVRFTPVTTTNNTTPGVAVPAPVQQPRPSPRRTPARAFIQFRPVSTTNAAPAVIPAGPPPVIPTSGGDRGITIRVFREIRPGDVPASGAQLPKLTGRAFAMPVAADVEHVTHAWDETLEDETLLEPSGPGLLEQARTELDELAKAARDAADAIDRAADRARPIVEGIGSKAYDLGKIFGSQPYDPRPRKVCGSVHMAGGVVLTCQRKPHDDGWHSDKGLHWR